MEIEGFEVIRLELKYCERCGGLWLRLQDVQDV
jgi:Zn-finger nucleic acid-binding protein